MYCELYDAGTVPVISRAAVPGMDQLYWREADFEEQVGEDLSNHVNAEMRDCEPFDLAPWPELLPRHVWVDYTNRYDVSGDDGLRFELHLRDPDSGECYPIPAGDFALLPDPEPDRLAEEGRLLRGAAWREIQAVEGSSWLRLDTINETGGTDLEAALVMGVLGAGGNAHRLVLPDNSFFAPFDMTLGRTAYSVTDDDGNPLDGEHWLDLVAGQHYRLYLRPRRWRYVATVVATFFYASFFEAFETTEVFTRAHFDRPPYYPHRHNLLTNRDELHWEDWYGNPLAWDPGVDWQWSHSRSSGYLRDEILAAQQWELCWVYVLTGVSDASVVVWRYPPEPGHVVLGIGRVDLDGHESRVWVSQSTDRSADYPQTVLGRFLVPFYVDTNA